MNTVTVVVPTVPGREHLASRALASIDAQSHPAARVITVFDQERDGPGTTRNRGLAQVDTEFVAFLDDDDEMMPWHLEALLSGMRPHITLTYSGCVMRDREGYRLPPWKLAGQYAWSLPWALVKPALAKQNYIASAVLVRTQAAKGVGGYPLGGPYEDWEFLRRLIGTGVCEFKGVDVTSFVYDISAASTHPGGPGRPA